MRRLRVSWNGSPVTGGGLSTFYFTDTVTDVSAVKTFFTALTSQFPPGLSWTIPNEVDLIDPADGELLGSATVAGGGTVTAAGTDTRYVLGAGLRVVWLTNGVARGRKVRGSAFMVPLEAYCYESDGSIAAATLTQFTNAATALAATTGFEVWSRPRPGAADGAMFGVSGAKVPDRVSTLRSRRT